MSPTMKTLGIDRLSVSERLQLLEEIWESIAATPDAVAVTPEMRDELDRRIADHEANPQAGSTWEEVKARLQRRL